MPLTLKSLSTACRYAATPNRYPFLWRATVGRILGAPTSLDQTAEQSIRFCRQRAISNEQALKLLTQSESPGLLQERYPDEFTAAEAAVADCPQKMGGGANMTLLHDLVSLSGAKNVLETGVAYGWSSLAILLALRDHAVGRLISTNLQYREYEDDTWVGCAVPDSLRDQWHVIYKADVEAIPEALAEFDEGRIDLCHYDSNKSYGGRMDSYAQLWTALKPGGLLVSDDIQDNLAFFHFCKKADVRPIVTPADASNGTTKYVGILKREQDCHIRDLMF